MLDLLLMRYGSIDFILNCDIELALDLIDKAKEQERDKRFFLQWVVQLPFMHGDSIMSFSDYKDRVTMKNVDFRPREEIEKEILELHKKKGGNKNGDGNF